MTGVVVFLIAVLVLLCRAKILKKCGRPVLRARFFYFCDKIMQKSLFFGLFLLSACSVDEQKLLGHWQATAFFEAGQSLATPLDSVRLSFAAGHRYEFRSVGFYHESGHFRSAGKLLFLTDTTAAAPQARAVEVLYLSPDSLKIGMKNSDRAQTLFLAKMRTGD
jgi:hypothetical protein